MSVATTTAIGIAGAVAAAGSVAGSAIASNTQAGATKQASDTTAQTAANSLAFNKDVYNTTTANEQPYMAAGSTAVNALQAGISDGSLTSAYPGGAFSFSGVNLQNDPAYQFDLTQGQQAEQRSAAAQGGLVSGGALKDLNDYTQGYASNQYEQSYTNALAAYNQAYNQFETTQGNAFSRLSSVAGLGQNAVTQTATSGNAAAGTNAGVNTSTANTLANLTTAQGNVSGAATIADTNAVNNGVNTYANALAQQSGSSYGANVGNYLNASSQPGYWDAPTNG